MKSKLLNIYSSFIYIFGFMLLLLMAIPRGGHFKGFSEGINSAIGTEATMVGVPMLAGDEGSYIYMPAEVDQILAFNVPKTLSSFVFPRDSNFVYESGKVQIMDGLGSVLSELALGSEVTLDTQKLSYKEGTAYKIPQLSSDLFILAVTSQSVQNMFVLSKDKHTKTNQHLPFSSIAIVSNPDFARSVALSESYKSLGEVFNHSYSFLNSTEDNDENEKVNLKVALEKAKLAISSDKNLPDSLTNTALQVYAHLESLSDSNEKDTDGQYGLILSGVQTDIVSKLISSQKTVLFQTEPTNIQRKALALTNNDMPPEEASEVGSYQTNQESGAFSAKSTQVAQTSSTVNKFELPEKAKIGTASLSAPCDPMNGYITHSFQDRKCTASNRFEIPLGIFSLLYNSRKSDDTFYSAVGVKHNYHEYVTKDLKYYVNASDQKIALVKSGNALKPSFEWGTFSFTISGSSIIRIDRSKGFKYIYKQITSKDSVYRLSEVQLNKDNSKVLVLGYSTVSPFSLKSIQYRPKIGETALRKAEISSSVISIGGKDGYGLKIDYPSGEDKFKDVTVNIITGALYSIAIGSDYKFNFKNGTSVTKRTYPLGFAFKKLSKVESEEFTINYYFGYDKDGRLTYKHLDTFTPKGKKLTRAFAYSYPKAGSIHSVTTLDNFGDTSKETYGKFGSNMLKVSFSGPYGDNLIDYNQAPKYLFYRFYDARLKAWSYQVTKHDEDSKVEKYLDSTVITSRKNDTYTVVTKDNTGVELSRYVYSDKLEGQYSFTMKSGMVETSESLYRVANKNDNWKKTKSSKIDGKSIVNLSALTAPNFKQVTDVDSGAMFKQSIVGDKTTETITFPNLPTYIKELTSVSNDKTTLIDSKETLGGDYLSKGKARVTKEGSEVSWSTESTYPVSASQSWRKYSDAFSVKTKTRENTMSMVAPEGNK